MIRARFVRSRSAMCCALLVAAALALSCGSNSNNATNNKAPASVAATQAATMQAATASASAATQAPTSATTTAPRSPTPAAAAPTPAPARLSGTLTVLAAASLTNAFQQEAQAFQQLYPDVKPKFSFDASSTLEAQLAQGAKADIFASADVPNMQKAQRDGVIDGEPQIFAKNKLVVIIPKSNPGKIASLADLARPGIKFVLADPSVPIGNYARTVLKNLSQESEYGPDFANKVLANLKSEEANARAVVAKVQTGDADAGMCYATDVTPAAAKDIDIIPIPDKDNLIAQYPIAVVKGAPNKEAARAFIAFLRSPQGQAILKNYNFILDKDTGTQTSARRLAYRAEVPYSPSFVLDGLVATPMTFDYDALAALPSVDETVSFIAGGGMETHTYRGVRLYDLLQLAGPQNDPSRKNDLIRFYVHVTGADGYTAVLAWGEFDPFLEGKDVLVAYPDNGQPLPPGSGMAKLVVPGDSHGARYVSGIVSIVLMAAPLPG